MVTRKLAAAVAGSLLFGGACAIYGPSLLAGDAGPDAQPGDAGDAGDPPCNAARWPDRPAKDDGNETVPEFVVAVRSFSLDPDAGATAPRGWDLDRRCTCPGPASCNPAADAAIICDDSNGRDNSAGLLFVAFSAFAGDIFNLEKMSERIGAGEGTFLVRIKDYNGTQNDTQVTTATFMSNGTRGAEDGGTPTVPQWDGGDEWTVAPNTLFGGTGPPYVPLPDAVDTAAYVTNGMLVSMMNEVNILFTTSTASALQLNASGVVVTGHLVQKSGGWGIDDGMLAGRWSARRFLTSFATLRDPLSKGAWLCGDSGTYASIKPLVCRNRDITALLQNDNTNAYCDALSIGFGFVAAPATMGNLYARPPPPQPCGAQWDDQCGN